ncbi:MULTISPECIES: hypothetical protein [Paracoccus]|jgi:hypothetical protein|nr:MULTISPECIES: hypothetical protein [Paracoccus]MBB4625999.1 hypothetical protein [Paracoccus denitrificans]MCU7426841.1 hypothetical protein [Paracoccus denitrificans]MDK8871937.1 hypothetical protein [Paracoccus sp. SSJ]WQO36341.1 hypothetical protein U0005_17875 [Paracoccus denitrificans]SDI37957.1 hypothetical protein SAMN04244581_01413 [Paracoccus denitrificans]
MRQTATGRISRFGRPRGGIAMNSIIYLVGLVVVVLFILGLLGLR